MCLRKREGDRDRDELQFSWYARSPNTLAGVCMSQNGERVSQWSRQYARDNNRTVEDAQTLCIYAPHDNVCWWPTCASFAQKSSRVLLSFLSLSFASLSLSFSLFLLRISVLTLCHGCVLATVCIVFRDMPGLYSYRQDIVSASLVYGYFLTSVCGSFHRVARFLPATLLNIQR